MTWTALALEGVAPNEVTAELLVELMDLCAEHGLDVEGISVNRRGSRRDC